MRDQVIVGEYVSPCGVLLIGSFGNRLCLCDWQSGRRTDVVRNRLKQILNTEFEEGSSPVIELAKKQLDEYFTGERREFDIPILFVGTDFQKRVWNELLKIPYSKTISYGDLAKRIGRPKAVRAVANANGANAISIFTPCHRVIGNNGSLTGYAGGLEAKAYLLRLEQAF